MPRKVNYSILRDVAVGLSYLHGQTPPIIHRDLSSNNVLLSSSMSAKISDLGMAVTLNVPPLQARCMTQTPGTPAYMPPEVMIANPQYDMKVDIFSYGILAIHMFSGQWPQPHVPPTRMEAGILVPVSEAERRQMFLDICQATHPLDLMPLILQCIDNNPQQRLCVEEIVTNMKEMTSKYPSSFNDRVSILRHIENAGVTDASVAHRGNEPGDVPESQQSQVRHIITLKLLFTQPIIASLYTSDYSYV